MPIITDRSGRHRYATVESLYPELSPRNISPEYFVGNWKEYRRRITHAKGIVLEAVRRHGSPQLAGHNFELTIPEDCEMRPAAFIADFANAFDSRRYRRLVKQRERERRNGGDLGPDERRMRSPQPRGKRRAAIFSGADFSESFFDSQPLHEAEMRRIVETIRLMIIEDAVSEMIADESLTLLGNTWLVKVSVMDRHIKSRKRHVARGKKGYHNPRTVGGSPKHRNRPARKRAAKRRHATSAPS